MRQPASITGSRGQSRPLCFLKQLIWLSTRPLAPRPGSGRCGVCLSSPGSWHGAPVLGWALCTVEGQTNDRQISREQVWGLWAPGPGSHWNALCIWLWSRMPYCLASECSQQALFFKPPPPALLWNLFTAVLEGLLEEPLRRCAQTEGELTHSWAQGPWAGRGGRGGRASSGMEVPLLRSPCPPPYTP